MNNQKSWLITDKSVNWQLSRKIIFILLMSMAIATILFAVITVAPYLDLQKIFSNTLKEIQSMGHWAALTFILLYIVSSIFFIPSSFLTLGAGIIFGLTLGSIYVCIAAIIAATLAFIMGRYLALDWVEKQIENHQYFKCIDNAVAREGWKIVFLARLSPLFPFSISNYIFSVSRVSLKDYFFASSLGLIPSNIMYVYIGSLAGDITNLGVKFSPKSQIELTLQIMGVILTIAATMYITHLTKKALASEI